MELATLIQTLTRMEGVSKRWASIILIWCLFLASSWNTFYHDFPNLTITHPWVFKIADGFRSPMRTKMHQFVTSFHPILCVFLIPLAQRLCPKMLLPSGGLKLPFMRGRKYFDLWYWYYVYFFAWMMDFILTYRTGDFRIYCSIVLIIMQLWYVVREWRG